MKNKTGNLINLKSMFKILKGIGLPKKFSKTEFELYATQLYLAHNVEAYRNILRKFKVKVIHQHQECWPMPLSLALAAKLEDAVFIWNHWSVDHYLFVIINWLCRYCFSWENIMMDTSTHTSININICYRQGS